MGDGRGKRERGMYPSKVPGELDLIFYDVSKASSSQAKLDGEVRKLLRDTPPYPSSCLRVNQLLVLRPLASGVIDGFLHEHVSVFCSNVMEDLGG